MMKLEIEGLYLNIIKAVYGKPNLEQTLHKKRGGRVDGREGPEFKSQYHKKKNALGVYFSFTSFHSSRYGALASVKYISLLY
jgi:hypothetical protein